MSRLHAVLRPNASGGWDVEDAKSPNGIYVNGRRVARATLGLGDRVYIMGMEIIAGDGFFSINSGRPDVTVPSPRLSLISSMRVSTLPEEEPCQPFNREPRHRLALAPKDIDFELPPMSLSGERIPLILRVGGSAMYGATSLLSGNLLPLASSVLFPLVTSGYTEKQRKEYEERRQTKYSAYLKQKQDEIAAEATREATVLRANYPTEDVLLGYPPASPHLWERRPSDDDFLHLRVGTSRLPLKAAINYPRERFQLDTDNLEERMRAVASKPVYLEDAPMVLSLVDNYVCGIQAPRALRVALVHEYLAQVAILHSWDEVKVVLAADKDTLEQDFTDVMALPHLWDDLQETRLVVSDEEDAYRVGSYLRTQLAEDLQHPRDLKDIHKSRPYYVVLALDRRLLDSMEVIKDVLALDANCGVTVVTAFGDLLKESRAIIRITGDPQAVLSGGGKVRGKVSYPKDIEREDDKFVAQLLPAKQIAASMCKLANVPIVRAKGQRELPRSLGFLEMMHVGNIQQLAPLRRWRENDPTKSLAVPVGVTPEGTTATLDLHEKYQGPHGLVAGMTGSGKSEFLLTYVLSLAINFSPDEVAFVLIDYKGGGLACAFVDEARGIHLPHVVATITNLDGSSIQRSLISLESEVKRRQEVFNRTKSATGEGTMDIYSYQRLHRRGVVAEPMPHLFIISDEFAELKQQQPEFMDELISIARIGRSLGVHLILATQKPAGVVNDQIWSNSKFKVCLKVQTKQDSMDMLKRPEAAELTQVGRYYLQVGYNESFSLGQSGWSGHPYEPADQYVPQEDLGVRFFGTTGQTLLAAMPQPKRQQTGKSELVAVVEDLCRVAKEADISPKSLWLPPLPAAFPLEELPPVRVVAPGEKIEVPVGWLDDPERQRRLPMVVPIQAMGNLMIQGEPGSGKTMLLQTMVLRLAEAYGPDRVNFYLLDYSSRMLKHFRALPHCGVVLGEEDSNSLDAFFKLIRGIVDERKKLFDQLEVDSFEAACQLKPLPLVVVGIDNIAGLQGTKRGQDLAYQLPDLLRDGLAYGVRFVVTLSQNRDAQGRIRQELGGRIALTLKDRYDYGEVLGTRVSVVPPALPGRGLFLEDDRPLEFQAGMLEPEATASQRPQLLKQRVGELAERWQDGPHAPGLKTITIDESYEDFAAGFGTNRLPLGYDLKSGRAIALPLRQFYTFPIYLGNPSGAPRALADLLVAAKANGATVMVAKAKDSLFAPGGDLAALLDPSATVADCTYEGMHGLWLAMRAQIMARKDVLQAYCAEQGLAPSRPDLHRLTHDYLHGKMGPVWVVFERMADFENLCREPALPNEQADPEGYRRASEAAAQAKVCREVLKGYLGACQIYNFNFFACYYPDDPPAVYSSDFGRTMAKEAPCLLMGGNLQAQRLLDTNRDLRDFNPQRDYRLCLMGYRGGIHAVGVPGPALADGTLPDERSIFEEPDQDGTANKGAS